MIDINFKFNKFLVRRYLRIIVVYEQIKANLNINYTLDIYEFVNLIKNEIKYT